MSNLIILPQKDIEVIEKQIKLQKRSILLFPLLASCLILAGIIRNYGHMPPFIINILALVPMILVGIYSPLSKGNLLSKTIYSLEILENSIQLTAFGTLWRSEEIITINSKDIQIDNVPLPKLLYNKYKLNNIYIEGKKYYIFNSLIEESGLMEKKS